MNHSLVRNLVVALAVLGAWGTLAHSPSLAQSTPTPTPIATPTRPVTSVPQFPSPPLYLRAFPGPEEDSWYVYASGFTPRSEWTLVEVLCPGLPCSRTDTPLPNLVNEDGTMSFYVRLPRAATTAQRTLAVVAKSSLGEVPADVLTVQVAAHNPGVGLGYPTGTRTGVAAVDQVIALVEAHDTASIRARLVMKDGATTTGEPVRGFASWQCQPYIQSEANLDQVFEYPSGALYAVFRIPANPGLPLPLRYSGAAYGLAFYDGGTGIPLGGLILVSASGQIVGTEIRCGTTPGFHVHAFTDFLLPPFIGPAPSTTAPQPPATGSGSAIAPSQSPPRAWLAAPAAFALTGLVVTLALRRCAG